MRKSAGTSRLAPTKVPPARFRRYFCHLMTRPARTRKYDCRREIRDRGKRKQLLQSRDCCMKKSGFVVNPSHGPVQTGQFGITQKRGDQSPAGVLSIRGRPVVRAKQARQLRGQIGIDERLASAKRLLKVRQRESGIDGEKCPVRVGGLQSSVRPAGLPEPVTKNMK